MHFRHVLTPFELLCCIDREDTVSLNHTVVEVELHGALMRSAYVSVDDHIGCAQSPTLEKYL